MARASFTHYITEDSALGGTDIQRFKINYATTGQLSSISDKTSGISSVSIDSAAGGDITISTSYEIGNGFTLGAGASGQEGSTTDGIFTKESNDIIGLQLAYAADSYGAAISYASADTPTTDAVYWGFNGYYSFDNAFLDSVSVGYEVGNPSVGDDAKGYMVGITTAEIGPGAISLGMATYNDIVANALIVDDTETTMLYEVSYGWSINDATSASVGAFLQERDAANGEDLSGIALTTSFAF